MATTSATRASSRNGSRTDLAVLLVLALAARAPAAFAERHLTFDDGVYGASAVAMRAGGRPFRDVFSSQGPLHLPLVWLGDQLGFRTQNAPRLVSVVAGLGLVVVTYVGGRRISDRAGALLASGLVGLTGSILWVTGPLAADGIALAFATLTMAALLAWRDDLTVRRAAVLGLGISATVSVKALLLPIAVPVALALLVGRRWAPIVVGATVAASTHLLLWLPWGIGDVWEQSYGYHLDVAGSRTPGENLGKLLGTLGDRDLPVLLALVAVIVGVVIARRSPPAAEGPRATSPDVLLGAWLAATVVVLLLEHPLWRPHVSQVIPAMALLVARHRPPLRLLAAAALVAVPYHLVHVWDLLRPAPYRGETADTVAILEDLPPGALAISDDPGIVWRAGRRTPPDLVDASILRIQVGQITERSVLAAADAPDVCAVVVRSTVRWGAFEGLSEGLIALGYAHVQDLGGGRGTYVDEGCEPG